MSRSVWAAPLYRTIALGAVACLLAQLLAAPARAQAVDLHAFWEDRCQACHGHSAAFARHFLKVDSQGRLQGSHHRDDLVDFLRQHYLPEPLLAPVTSMLAAQVVATPTFAGKCARCHDTASAFVRSALTWTEGRLVGRASGVPVQDFLKRHGNLTPTERPAMVDTLNRLYKEVGSPP